MAVVIDGTLGINSKSVTLTDPLPVTSGGIGASTLAQAGLYTKTETDNIVANRIMYFEQATMPTGVPSGSVWLDTDTGVKAMLNIDNGVDIWVEF
jgi:hypothetical protein